MTFEPLAFKSIKDKKWQKFRESLKGLSTKEKLRLLKQWQKINKNSKKSNIQIENYKNALARAGLI